MKTEKEIRAKYEELTSIVRLKPNLKGLIKDFEEDAKIETLQWVLE